jgi:hypothetical protein
MPPDRCRDREIEFICQKGHHRRKRQNRLLQRVGALFVFLNVPYHFPQTILTKGVHLLRPSAHPPPFSGLAPAHMPNPATHLGPSSHLRSLAVAGPQTNRIPPIAMTPCRLSTTAGLDGATPHVGLSMGPGHTAALQTRMQCARSPGAGGHCLDGLSFVMGMDEGGRHT